MGNDFEARKRAKKRKATDIDPEIASEGGKKGRKKRAAVRRLCKGMCYNEPTLTEDDLTWEGGETADGTEEDSHRERRAAQAAITEINRAKEEALAKKQSARAKQKKKKAARQAGQHFSTAVDLTEPSQIACSRPDANGQTAEPDFLRNLGFPLSASIKQYLARQGFSGLMPIQERCLPACLGGHDVIAQAEPGSGKTLGYLLPAAAHLESHVHDAASKLEGPLVLILVPTRELALQVATVCRTFHRELGFQTQAIIGGIDKDQQIKGLEKKPHLVVATPGRLLDLYDEDHICLGDVSFVVLDEADKMLSLGLQPQLYRLRKLLLPRKRKQKQGALVLAPSRKRPQVLMFSATSSLDSEQAASKWLHTPERILVGASAASMNSSVTQSVHVCAEHKKLQKLLKHLQQVKVKSKGLRNPPKVLILANRIKTVRFLHQSVAEAEFRAVMLHGERSQPEREGAMRDFRGGKAQVMIATDVAARGLHIRGLPYVVNYDFPSTLEQYIHRAGRAGRLASNGHCYSFFTRNLAPLAQPLLALLLEHVQNVDPNLAKLAEAYQTAAEKLKEDADAFMNGSKSEPLDAAKDDIDMLEQLLGDGPTEEPVDDHAEDFATGAGQQTGLAPGSKESVVPQKRGQPKKALPGRLRKKLRGSKGKL